MRSAGGFSLLCGRYEGVDQRVADHLVDGELSVGDFVLAGGELAALVVVEAVARLLPDVLGNEDSARDESFSDGLLEYPQYTRPAEFRGWAVPEVLRSGDHGAVAAWRRCAGPAPDGRAPPGSDRAPGQGVGAQRQRRAGPLRARLRCSVRHRAGVTEGRLSCTPPKRSIATACATTSPSSAPATPSRSTSGSSRATGSGCRSSRVPSCGARAAACRRRSPCARSASASASSGPSRCTRRRSPRSRSRRWATSGGPSCTTCVTGTGRRRRSRNAGFPGARPRRRQTQSSRTSRDRGRSRRSTSSMRWARSRTSMSSTRSRRATPRSDEAVEEAADE